MQEDANPVKEYMFDYIKKSHTITNLVFQKKFDEVTEEITKNCYEKIISMGDKAEAIGVLATAILHYLLTNALISTQRKIEYNGLEIDIVIPDIKTLEKDHKKTLLIYIPKTLDKKTIDEKISQLEKIQPEKSNIWVVLSKDIDIDKKYFVLSKKNSSFSKIIFEIAQFNNVRNANKFKILRV